MKLIPSINLGMAEEYVRLSDSQRTDQFVQALRKGDSAILRSLPLE